MTRRTKLALGWAAVGMMVLAPIAFTVALPLLISDVELDACGNPMSESAYQFAGAVGLTLMAVFVLAVATAVWPSDSMGRNSAPAFVAALLVIPAAAVVLFVSISTLGGECLISASLEPLAGQLRPLAS